jgi:hypothetical protein
VPRTDSTRYIDTLAGPRRYTELAPDLARVVEDVCVRYLASLAAADHPDYLELKAIWAERLRT